MQGTALLQECDILVGHHSRGLPFPKLDFGRLTSYLCLCTHIRLEKQQKTFLKPKWRWGESECACVVHPCRAHVYSCSTSIVPTTVYLVCKCAHGPRKVGNPGIHASGKPSREVILLPQLVCCPPILEAACSHHGAQPLDLSNPL